MRLKLTLAYDGRAFTGWQSQPGANAVQDVLESAVGRILKAPAPRVHGSGRTDSGVHALGQVAHFDAPESCRMSPETWHRALNANLPPSLRVMNCAEAPPDFHSRFQATGKVYQYRIWMGPILPPLEVGMAWHIWRRLDPTALDAARAELTGRHDFSAFFAYRGDLGEKNPGYAVRNVHSIEPEWGPHHLILTFHGKGFLYKMVRMLTGSLLRVAEGRATLDWLRELRDRPAGRKTPFSAPADGLYLVRVEYEEGAQ